MPAAVETIGRRMHEQEKGGNLVFAYEGDRIVKNLSDIGIAPPGTPHYTDSLELYNRELSKYSKLLKSHRLYIHYPDGKEKALKTFEEILPFCDRVNQEYAETVTKRLRTDTGNPKIGVPKLNPDMVYASYVALLAGEAVVLPTSVGNIVAAASDKGLGTMFTVKERGYEKSGVVLTTLDQLPELAEIPAGWEGYLKYMHDQGVLVGSKLTRKDEHPLFKNQPEWSRDKTMFKDGTSMFVFLPGPYSDVMARILASEGLLLTASSANKSHQGNNRDIALLHPDIKRGCSFVAWDRKAITAYPLDVATESQGVMVDFRPKTDGTGQFHVLRSGFMIGPFMRYSIWYLQHHPELNVLPSKIEVEVFNSTDQGNK